MKTVYGFDDDRAKMLSKQTRSWIAVPLISSRGDIEGVLYCDSKQRDFFNDERKNAVMYAAVGIAFYVAVKYHRN
jgi:putative methionine-R-sulfoxide reductase with GAF domain